MVGYFDEVLDGFKPPGQVARSIKLIKMQSAIERAIDNLVTDNFGQTYILSDTKDALELTPLDVEPVELDSTGDPVKSSQYIDQEFVFSESVMSFKELQNLYVRDIIDIDKSSIFTLRLTFKNTSSATIPVLVQIKDIHNKVIDVASARVAHYGGKLQFIDFKFERHHLPLGKYYIVIKRTNVNGLKIGYKVGGGVGRHPLMSESDDGVHYSDPDEIPIGSLWFQDKYGDAQTFDVKKATCMMYSDKVPVRDTHITLPDPPKQGSRIDTVYLNHSGYLDCLEGKPASYPKPAKGLKPDKDLIVAYVRCEKGKPLASQRDVDQNQTQEHTRRRKLLYRIRDLEKQVAWLREYNAPQRFKYNVTGTNLIDVGASIGMAYDDASGGFKVGSESLMINFNSKKDDGFTSWRMNHSDHVKGKIILATHSDYDVAVEMGHDNLPRLLGTGATSTRPGTMDVQSVFIDEKRVDSHYMGGHFQIEEDAQLYSISNQFIGMTDPGHPENMPYNVKSGKIVVFEVDSNLQPIILVEESEPLPISKWDTTDNDPRKYSNLQSWTTQGTTWYFSGTKTLDAEKRYAWILVPELKDTKLARCDVKTHRWRISPEKTVKANGKTYTAANIKARNDSFVLYAGSFPPKIPTKANQKHSTGMLNLKEHTHYGIGFRVRVKQNVFYDSGYLESEVFAMPEGADIHSVRVNANLIHPDETSYTLSVSCDGGAHYYPILEETNKNQLTYKGRRTFTTPGSNFRFKLEFKTQNEHKSPYLIYDAQDKYTLLFTLSLSAGGDSDGVLVTVPFFGPGIAAYALGYKNSVTDHTNLSTDIFSHWEWIRAWMDKNDGEIYVDIEGTNQASNETGTYIPYNWSVVRANLSPEDFIKTPVDYDGTVDIDEYNYHSESEPNSLGDITLIDNAETRWTGKTGVTTALDSSRVVSGTYSNKINITSSAGEGLLTYIPKDLGISHHEYFTLRIYPERNYSSQNFRFLFCSDSTGEDVIQQYYIPAMTAGEWNTFTFEIQDPSELTRVGSIALASEFDPNETHILNIDYITASTRVGGVIDNCESGWLKAQSEDVDIDFVSGQQQGSACLQVTVNGETDTGLLAYKKVNLNLSQYRNIRFWFKHDAMGDNNSSIASGDIQLTLCSDEAGKTPLNTFNIPSTEHGVWTRVMMDFENPVILTAVKSIGIKARFNPTQVQYFFFDQIEGVESQELPFYHKYLRLKFKVSLPEGKGTHPPVIKKVGLVGILG
jgi:hypothetical protein